MSNWEKRPLRESQVHYAAMDVYILIAIVNEIIKQEGLNKVQALIKEKTTHG
jgi:ribonuclease D